MGANPHANGGKLLRALHMPDFRNYAVSVPAPTAAVAGNVHVLGPFLRDVMKLNEDPRHFRLFGPDERSPIASKPSSRSPTGNGKPGPSRMTYSSRPSGSVMEMLSEHQCEGWLEGYLLTGRHGLFNSYEAFIRIVDSMFTQHAKWLKMCAELPWRRSVASLNYLLTSHVWRQDHNGFTHQDPGFIDHVINKKSEMVRVYLPPDANCLLSTMDHCLRSLNYINVVVCGKHDAPQWLTMDAAVEHCTEGIGIWQWASNDQGGEPDVVMACCGDVPTLETLAAVSILREHLPELKVRVVNVVDLMKLEPDTEGPHGLSDIGLRFALHERQAHHLRLPRIPLADPPADLPPGQPQPARPRLQGRGHDHDRLRHDGHERHGSLPPGDGYDRSPAADGHQGGLSQAAACRTS